MASDGFYVGYKFGLEKNKWLQAGFRKVRYANSAICRSRRYKSVITAPIQVENGIAIGLSAWTELIQAIGAGHGIKHGNHACFISCSQQARLITMRMMAK
jgi:hypothetical protein